MHGSTKSSANEPLDSSSDNSDFEGFEEEDFNEEEINILLNKQTVDWCTNKLDEQFIYNKEKKKLQFVTKYFLILCCRKIYLSSVFLLFDLYTSYKPSKIFIFSFYYFDTKFSFSFIYSLFLNSFELDLTLLKSLYIIWFLLPLMQYTIFIMRIMQKNLIKISSKSMCIIK